MAEGIVLQLQKEALDENVDIETLLRKAYLVARKLQLKDFEEWILYEQNGYKNNIPDYRVVGGEIKAWNPFYGWVPVVLDGRASDILNRIPLGSSIAAISEAYNSSDGSVSVTVPGTLADWLNEQDTFLQTNYSFRSSKAEFRRIISAVRNRILEWSIMLEENGIVGEGLGFTDYEVKIAHESQVINNYTNNFYSTVDNTDIQQGGNNNQQ